MGVYNASITKNSDGDHVLHLSRTLAPLSGFPAPIAIRTSADLKVGISGFDKTAAQLHSVRADHGGAAKGRLLYVATGGAALAFLAVHVPPKPGPIICEAYATAAAVNDMQHDLMRAHLLAAAQELSDQALRRAGQTGKLAWATDLPTVREEVLEVGFRTASKPPGSDCDRTHYLEATFD